MADEITLDIEMSYPSGQSIQAGLSLPLAPGITILFGPSGAGKTTILRCLAGLERPRRGLIRFGKEIWFDSQSGVFLPPPRRRIGYVFQDDALFPHLTVRGNIAYGLARMPAQQRETRITEMLRLLGLEHLADRHPKTLSGGQRRRVAIARALAPEPRLLLLDEPLSALDAPARSDIQAEIRRLVTTRGIPAIMVTHDRAEAMAMGDWMAVVIEGRVRQFGTVEEVFARPANLEVAFIVGVDTVVPGRILRRDEGMAEVEVAAGCLLALDPGGTATEVFVSIRGEDVVLAKNAAGPDPGLEGLSARNRLRGRVTALTPEGPVYRVVVNCGFPLAALVTRQTVQALKLSMGDEVVAAVKAPSVHLFPRVSQEHSAPLQPRLR